MANFKASVYLNEIDFSNREIGSVNTESESTGGENTLVTGELVKGSCLQAVPP